MAKYALPLFGIVFGLGVRCVDAGWNWRSVALPGFRFADSRWLRFALTDSGLVWLKFALLGFGHVFDKRRAVCFRNVWF